MSTIVTSRAGKDLISSLCSGLLTIGSRFGGALDKAAYMFPNAWDTGLTPCEFVDNSQKQNKLISGIGHKIKSVNILNVDGCIAICFIDLLRDSGAFSHEEADEYIKIGCLNGLFVLGHSIGFIGHHLDQKRVRAPLYRHPAASMNVFYVRRCHCP